MDVTKTKLYRALRPAIRKQDHGTLRNELQRIATSGHACNWNATDLRLAFLWMTSPQGQEYWHSLTRSIEAAAAEAA